LEQALLGIRRGNSIDGGCGAALPKTLIVEKEKCLVLMDWFRLNGAVVVEK
jgi:hypothetical protein